MCAVFSIQNQFVFMILYHIPLFIALSLLLTAIIVDIIDNKNDKEELKEASKFSKILRLLKPNDVKLITAAVYTSSTTISSIFTIGTDSFEIWYTCRIITAITFYSYGMHQNKGGMYNIGGKYWMIGLIFALPMDIIFHCMHSTAHMFTLFLSFAHLIFAAYILPSYFSIPITAVTVFLEIIFPIYRLGMIGFLQSIINRTLLFFIFVIIGIISWFITLYASIRRAILKQKADYIKAQQDAQDIEEFHEIAYTLNMKQPIQKNAIGTYEVDSEEENAISNITNKPVFILEQTSPFYQEDLQNIVNQFSKWDSFLKEKSRSKDFLAVIPETVTIGELIEKVEIGLKDKLEIKPKIDVEHSDHLYMTITCDVDEVVDLLKTAILRIADKDNIEIEVVKFDIYSAMITYHDHTRLNQKGSLPIQCAAINIVISNKYLSWKPVIIHSSQYDDLDINALLEKDSLDINIARMRCIVRAHYGYVALPEPGQQGVLIVLPRNVKALYEVMISRLSTDVLHTESAVPIEEKTSSLTDLIKFHEYISSMPNVNPIVISEILLLLRRCYGFNRHACGELFYVRTIEIAKLMTQWFFHSPQVVYAALLYDLVRYTKLPISYIRSNYNLNIFVCVQSILNVDQHKDLKTALFGDSNDDLSAHGEQLIVLYIKLAERIYDLRHAAGYTNKEAVFAMLEETCNVYIDLAKTCLKAQPEIAAELDAVTKQVRDSYEEK
ncbi:HD domain-containing protein [Cardinium endosymbiont of Culicoides punctatus]|uniref:HD domain-containing protein n=1 Tax=Cardinium endosymbiont of Culicoides punctatus TaxID=2304601 RepID=UPI001058A61A|nr:HD domain-containing protein [Cardinium endosymbiont of Culicoides punctatus]TDG95007.1 hypothetical protein CCPUN_06640 [Cardinium endosymbiont of Culicoides punctatus]